MNNIISRQFNSSKFTKNAKNEKGEGRDTTNKDENKKFEHNPELDKVNEFELDLINKAQNKEGNKNEHKVDSISQPRVNVHIQSHSLSEFVSEIKNTDNKTIFKNVSSDSSGNKTNKTNKEESKSEIKVEDTKTNTDQISIKKELKINNNTLTNEKISIDKKIEKQESPKKEFVQTKIADKKVEKNEPLKEKIVASEQSVKINETVSENKINKVNNNQESSVNNSKSASNLKNENQGNTNKIETKIEKSQEIKLEKPIENINNSINKEASNEKNNQKTNESLPNNGNKNSEIKNKTSGNENEIKTKKNSTNPKPNINIESKNEANKEAKKDENTNKKIEEKQQPQKEVKKEAIKNKENEPKIENVKVEIKKEAPKEDPKNKESNIKQQQSVKAAKEEVKPKVENVDKSKASTVSLNSPSSKNESNSNNNKNKKEVEKQANRSNENKNNKNQDNKQTNSNANNNSKIKVNYKETPNMPPSKNGLYNSINYKIDDHAGVPPQHREKIQNMVIKRLIDDDYSPEEADNFKKKVREASFGLKVKHLEDFFDAEKMMNHIKTDFDFRLYEKVVSYYRKLYLHTEEQRMELYDENYKKIKNLKSPKINEDNLTNIQQNSMKNGRKWVPHKNVESINLSYKGERKQKEPSINYSYNKEEYRSYEFVRNEALEERKRLDSQIEVYKKKIMPLETLDKNTEEAFFKKFGFNKNNKDQINRINEILNLYKIPVKDLINYDVWRTFDHKIRFYKNLGDKNFKKCMLSPEKLLKQFSFPGDSMEQNNTGHYFFQDMDLNVYLLYDYNQTTMTFGENESEEFYQQQIDKQINPRFHLHKSLTPKEFWNTNEERNFRIMATPYSNIKRFITYIKLEVSYFYLA